MGFYSLERLISRRALASTPDLGLGRRLRRFLRMLLNEDSMKAEQVSVNLMRYPSEDAVHCAGGRQMQRGKRKKIDGCGNCREKRRRALMRLPAYVTGADVSQNQRLRPDAAVFMVSFAQLRIRSKNR